MTMALYELAYRPEIQSKLRKEIEEVSKRYDGKISYEALAEMQYLDQVVKGLRKIIKSYFKFNFVPSRNSSNLHTHRSSFS
jgi:hypothetical protein